MLENQVLNEPKDQEFLHDLLKINKFINPVNGYKDGLSTLIEDAKISDEKNDKIEKNPSQITFFYQKYHPYEKVIRYNIRHGFILFTNIYHGNFPSDATALATSVLSVANGAIQVLDGALQLTKETLHPMRDKAMGTIKILSGASAIALSYTPWITQLGITALSSSTILAGPAFALTRLVDLTSAAIDYHYARKDLKLSGWLEERYKEIETIDKKIISSPASKKDELVTKKNAIEENIRARLFCKQEKDPGYLQNINFKNKKTMELYQSHVQSVKTLPVKSQIEYREKNTKIKNDLRKDEVTKKQNLFVKAVAFSGALLLAVAPFTGLAAPFLFAIGLTVSIGVGLYSAGKLANASKKIENLFTDITDKIMQGITKLRSKDLSPIPSTSPRLK